MPIKNSTYRVAVTAALTTLFAFFSVAPLANNSDSDIGRVLPRSDAAAPVQLGVEVKDSVPSWPQRVRAEDGAPNILVILTDDEGFSASSVFGGPVPRPTLEALADTGLRYNRFHTTATCSPTRAALLTGRNPHAVRTGNIVDIATPYPGYWSNIPKSAATVARVLRDNGYNTAMFGKDHNVPAWERSAAGPFDHWPTGMGFEYFYGFVGGDADQWHPQLFRNTSRVKDVPLAEGEILDKALTDDAIDWLRNQQAAHSGKPFFMYFAPGSSHAPHQAPREWIEKFKGQFDQGWDRLRQETFARQQQLGIIPDNAVLTPRPAQIPAWDSLPAEQQRTYARMMEIFAAMTAYQDAQLGRLLHELERMGLRDNTLVVFITGDNGASGEGGPLGTTNEIGHMANGVHDSAEWLQASFAELGGPKTYQNYPVGWAWAANTPLRWVKQVGSHLGAVRNGLVISWPEGIKARGELRSQFANITDIAPTLLEAARVRVPELVDGVKQQPLDGVSLSYSFDNADAAERHTTQYFESQGNRAIYHEGWWANTVPERMPWQARSPAASVLDYRWELYSLQQDYSQSNNLAQQYPQKLQKLQALWLQEAKANQVLPIDDRFGPQRARPMKMWLAEGRTEFTYWGAGVQVQSNAAPMLSGRSFRVEAQLELAESDTTGVVLAMGSWFGGWSFYLKEGRPVAYLSVSTKPEEQFRIEARKPLAAGKVRLRYEFTPDGPGLMRGGKLVIFANDKPVAEGRVGRTIATLAGLGETLDVGFDAGTPVTEDYPGQGHFPAHIERVDIQLGPFLR